jgi:hypothetical protein
MFKGSMFKGSMFKSSMFKGSMFKSSMFKVQKFKVQSSISRFANYDVRSTLHDLEPWYLDLGIWDLGLYFSNVSKLPPNA